jgi:hypothetical protein
MLIPRQGLISQREEALSLRYAGQSRHSRDQEAARGTGCLSWCIFSTQKPMQERDHVGST